MMTLIIAAREVRSLFLSPLAWTILAIIQFITGYMFLIQIETFIQLQPRLAALEGAPGMTEIIVAPLFGNAAIVLLLVVPMLTMRLLSEELRSQTLSLLFSAPISMSEIVFGKYLGLLAFLGVMLVMLTLMPLSLTSGGSIDPGILLSGLLGLGLLLAAFSAVGLFMSSLTSQPVIAAISGFGILLLLWIIDWAGSTGGGDMQVGSVLAYLSILRHYEPLLRGIFNSSDIVYYLLFITTFLVLTIRQLDAYRLQH